MRFLLSFQQNTGRSLPFLEFVKSHLTGLVDVSVGLHCNQSLNMVLDTFLQIKTLKRLWLWYDHFDDNASADPSSTLISPSIYKSTHIPQCRDLVLLNLANLSKDSKISLEGMENIVKVSQIRATQSLIGPVKRECRTWRSCIWVVVSKWKMSACSIR
jgi:hypothetical protein